MLRELQLALGAELFAARRPVAEREVLAAGLTANRRLQVYANNTLTGLTEALRAVYPVVARLVGDGFFRYAADAYVRGHPATSGNLHDYGGALAAFLEGFEPAQGLPYLPDVARLEWARHHAFHGPGAHCSVLAALASIPADRHGELRFRVHPTARLVASDYPILRIWQVNQDDYEGERAVDLAEGGVRLLVLRPDLDVEIWPLAPGAHALLAALSAGRPFAEACERALAIQPEYDLPGDLRRLCRGGALAGVHL